MKNAPPENVTVSGWTAYAAMEALRRRVRLLESKRAETAIAADEEMELRVANKALNEIVDRMFPAPSPVAPEPSEASSRTGNACQTVRAPDTAIAQWEKELFERLAMSPVTARKERVETRFSNEELLSAIQLVLPDAIILRPEYEDVPKTSALYVLRAEMKAVRRRLDTALSLRENRTAAQKRNILARLSQWWRLKSLAGEEDGAAGDWEETATQRLIEICRHAQALRPQPRTSTKQHPWR